MDNLIYFFNYNLKNEFFNTKEELEKRLESLIQFGAKEELKIYTITKEKYEIYKKIQNQGFNNFLSKKIKINLEEE